MTRVNYQAFHGTRADAAEPICAQGLRPSRNHDDWLGAGTYFFVEGLDDPRESAFEWARCKLWDKAARSFEASDVAVVEATLSLDADSVFDLREPENARAFHQARRAWLKRRVPPRSTHLARPAEPSYDTALLDQFKVERGISALISDFYIQFFVRERHFRMDSRIPNCSVLCLTHPHPEGVELTVENVEILKPSSTLEGTDQS